MSGRAPASLLVVGTGLIGTSLALAARRGGVDVVLRDADPRRAATAGALGAGAVDDGSSSGFDLCVAAVPPAAVPSVVETALRTDLAQVVTHVASIQHNPQVEVERLLGAVSQFVGSHPVAGREVSGPQHADPELFRDRPWVVCPTPASAPVAVDTVLGLVQLCGAVPVVLDAQTHDRLLARLSHVPQLVASALAATLVGLRRDEAALAGSGIRDTTRIADSDPALWAEIASANAVAVAAGLRAVAEPLAELAAALETGGDTAAAAVAALVSRGRDGRSLLPGKHGRTPTAWATVAVVIPDRPGALADLLTAVAAHEVNLEDLRVDHAPGQPLGFVELAVPPGDRDRLVTALRDAGWSASVGSDAAG